MNSGRHADTRRSVQGAGANRETHARVNWSYMMSDRLHISRRTALRGLGTLVALPCLEAMLPMYSFAAPNARPHPSAKPPVRTVFLCVPNGKHMQDWTPSKE